MHVHMYINSPIDINFIQFEQTFNYFPIVNFHSPYQYMYTIRYFFILNLILQKFISLSIVQFSSKTLMPNYFSICVILLSSVPLNENILRNKICKTKIASCLRQV